MIFLKRTFSNRVGAIMLFFMLLWVLDLKAQNPMLRDTSFAVYSTFIKTKKQYPHITIANPLTPKGVKIKYDITFSKQGGRPLLLDVFYPKKKVKQGYPAVLMIFGGGWRSGDRSHNIPTAKLLAARGYVAVSADYRLSTEATYPAAVYDLKTAIRWLRANAKKYNIDTSKVATCFLR